jgi:hypothetical protein
VQAAEFLPRNIISSRDIQEAMSIIRPKRINVFSRKGHVQSTSRSLALQGDEITRRPDALLSAPSQGCEQRQPWRILSKHLTTDILCRVFGYDEGTATWELARLERISHERYASFVYAYDSKGELIDKSDPKNLSHAERFVATPEEMSSLQERRSEIDSQLIKLVRDKHRSFTDAALWVSIHEKKGNLPLLWEDIQTDPVKVSGMIAEMELSASVVIPLIARRLGLSIPDSVISVLS